MALKKAGKKVKKTSKQVPAKKSGKTLKAKPSPKKVVSKKSAKKKPVVKKKVTAKKAAKPVSKVVKVKAIKVVKKVIAPKPVKTPIVKVEKPVASEKDFKEVAMVSPKQGEKRIRKSNKKNIIALPPPPKIEISSFPKNKVKNILISQPKPVETEKNPYFDLAKKHGLSLTFRQFIKVEGLTPQDFRMQRIDIMMHGAVIMTSKLAVDHYFRICNEMRLTVPENMKYFCINEQTAYYLQKYIQYRKRKIFFGHGTIIDLVDVIRKNRNEKFLIPVSDVHKEQIVDFLDELQITYTKGTFYKTVCADLSDLKTLNDFDVVVFFTPQGIKSLKQNFPNMKQGNLRIAAFGYATAQMVKELGYRLDIFAPNPQNPSMSGALETYLKESNKR
jgi:uroporphyrinogen-III synthase